MTTQTETALAALFEALKTALLAANVIEDAAAVHRNEALPTRLAQGGGVLFVWVNQWDGATTLAEQYVGADVMLVDDAAARPYEIEGRPVIDFAVAGGTAGARNAAFDAGLVAINAAVSPAQVLGELTYLGGAVDSAAIEEVRRDGGGTVTEGLPNTRGAVVTPLLTYTSSTPF